VTTVLWQLEHDSARSYQDILVPTLMAPAARLVVERVGVSDGATGLAGGCGSGAASVAAASRAAPSGRVVAADVNRHLLQLGRSTAPGVEFWEADARALPFPDSSFDVVLCTHVLQFVPQADVAVAELTRVVRPGGRVAVSTWAASRRLPYLDVLASAVARHLGGDAAEPLTSATSRGEAGGLARLLQDGGLVDATTSEDTLTVRVEDLAAFIPAHLASTPVAPAAARVPEARMRALAEDVIAALGAGDGRDVDLPFVQLVGTGVG
jgi:SAM-dependent methyltransferase